MPHGCSQLQEVLDQPGGNEKRDCWSKREMIREMERWKGPRAVGEKAFHAGFLGWVNEVKDVNVNKIKESQQQTWYRLRGPATKSERTKREKKIARQTINENIQRTKQLHLSKKRIAFSSEALQLHKRDKDTLHDLTSYRRRTTHNCIRIVDSVTVSGHLANFQNPPISKIALM